MKSQPPQKEASKKNLKKESAREAEVPAGNSNLDKFDSRIISDKRFQKLFLDPRFSVGSNSQLQNPSAETTDDGGTSIHDPKKKSSIKFHQTSTLEDELKVELDDRFKAALTNPDFSTAFEVLDSSGKIRSRNISHSLGKLYKTKEEEEEEEEGDDAEKEGGDEEEEREEVEKDGEEAEDESEVSSSDDESVLSIDQYE